MICLPQQQKTNFERIKNIHNSQPQNKYINIKILFSKSIKYNFIFNQKNYDILHVKKILHLVIQNYELSFTWHSKQCDITDSEHPS